MQFSILIPTFNNLEYLKLLLYSIKKNSSFNHEIILFINDGSDGTLDYIKKKRIKFCHSKKNIGLCSSINLAAKKATKDFYLYAHDDMYFCPKWDYILSKEVLALKNKKFYLSGTMIEPKSGHIRFNFGETAKTFNEKKFLFKYDKLRFYDHQGTHFAPHLVSSKIWKSVKGFSEEFNPGDGSDPDFNMKLWNSGVRIFKGIDKFRVYHFSSVTTRKKKNFINNRGDKTFLKKWGISIKFFKKYYLKSKSKYNGPLTEPEKNLKFLIELLICKIKKITL